MEPDPEVMDKVMSALHKRRRRRMVWFWLLIPALLLGTAFFLLRENGASSTQVTENHNPENVQPPQTGSPQRSSVNDNDQSISGPGSENSHREGSASDQVTSSGTGNSVVPDNTTVNSGTTVTEHKQETAAGQNGNSTRTVTGNTHHDRRENEATRQTTTENNTAPASNSTFAEVVTTEANDQPNDNSVAGSGITHREKEAPVGFLTSGPRHITAPLSAPALSLQPFVQPVASAPRAFYHFSVGAWFRGGGAASRFEINPDDANPSTSKGYSGNRSEGDRIQFGYAAGLSFRYAPLKFLAIETGIGYSSFSSREVILDNSFNALQYDFYPETTNVAVSSLASGTHKTYSNQYGFLTIPVRVYFQQKWKWAGFEAGAGVSLDIPVHERAYEMEMYQFMVLRKDVESSHLNPVSISLDVNINAVFHAGRFSFYAGPAFRYQLNSMYNSSYVIRQKPYFIGGETGVRINF